MADKSNADLIKALLTSVKSLQSDMAALKSGAIGGSNSQPPTGDTTLLQTNSAVSGKDPPAKWQRSEEREDSEEDPPSSDEDKENILKLLETGSAFMDTAFKSKTNAASRKKWQSSGFRLHMDEDPRVEQFHRFHYTEGGNMQ